MAALPVQLQLLFGDTIVALVRMEKYSSAHAPSVSVCHPAHYQSSGWHTHIHREQMVPALVPTLRQAL